MGKKKTKKKKKIDKRKKYKLKCFHCGDLISRQEAKYNRHEGKPYCDECFIEYFDEGPEVEIHECGQCGGYISGSSNICWRCKNW